MAHRMDDDVTGRRWFVVVHERRGYRQGLPSQAAPVPFIAPTVKFEIIIVVAIVWALFMTMTASPIMNSMKGLFPSGPGGTLLPTTPSPSVIMSECLGVMMNLMVRRPLGGNVQVGMKPPSSSILDDGVPTKQRFRRKGSWFVLAQTTSMTLRSVGAFTGIDTGQVTYDVESDVLYVACIGSHDVRRVVDLSTFPTNGQAWTASVIAGTSGGYPPTPNVEVDAITSKLNQPTGIVGWTWRALNFTVDTYRTGRQLFPIWGGQQALQRWSTASASTSSPSSQVGGGEMFCGLFVMDSGNHLIRFINLQRGTILTAAGNTVGGTYAIAGGTNGIGPSSAVGYPYYGVMSVAPLWSLSAAAKTATLAAMGLPVGAYDDPTQQSSTSGGGGYPAAGANRWGVWVSAVVWADNGAGCIRQGIPISVATTSTASTTTTTTTAPSGGDDQGSNVTLTLESLRLDVSTISGLCNVGVGPSVGGLGLAYNAPLYVSLVGVVVVFPFHSIPNASFMFHTEGGPSFRLLLLAPVWPTESRFLSLVYRATSSLHGVTASLRCGAYMSTASWASPDDLLFTVDVIVGGMNLNVTTFMKFAAGSRLFSVVGPPIIGAFTGSNQRTFVAIPHGRWNNASSSSSSSYPPAMFIRTGPFSVFCCLDVEYYQVIPERCWNHGKGPRVQPATRTSTVGKIKVETATLSSRRSVSGTLSRTDVSGDPRGSATPRRPKWSATRSKVATASSGAVSNGIHHQSTSSRPKGHQLVHTLTLPIPIEAHNGTTLPPVTPRPPAALVKSTAPSVMDVYLSSDSFKAGVQVNQQQQSVATVATAALVPGAASKASSVARTMSTWTCIAVGPAEVAADDSLQFLRFGFEVGSGEYAAASGALVVTTGIRVVVWWILLFLVYQVPGSIAATAASVMMVSLGYFLPNVVGLITLVGTSLVGAADGGGGGSMAVIVVSAVSGLLEGIMLMTMVVPACRLRNGVRRRTNGQAEVGMGKRRRRGPGRPPEDIESGAAAAENQQEELIASSSSATLQATTSRTPTATLYRLCLLLAREFIEPVRRRKRILYRIAVLEDLLAAVLIAIISNLPKRDLSSCTFMSWFIFAISAAHLAYVVWTRPYRKTLDSIISIFLAVVTAIFSLMCCVVPRTEEGATWIGWGLMGMTGVFYFSLVVGIGMAIHEAIQSHRRRDKQAATAAVGGSNPSSSGGSRRSGKPRRR